MGHLYTIYTPFLSSYICGKKNKVYEMVFKNFHEYEIQLF